VKKIDFAGLPFRTLTIRLEELQYSAISALKNETPKSQ